jgi:hypothetical protein
MLMSITDQALIQLARDIGDAMHRFANTVAAQRPPTTPVALVPDVEAGAPEKLTPAERYYRRQARLLRPIADAGGSVGMTEGRKLARAAGYGRGWQQLWRPNGLLVRQGNTLTLTDKGRERLEFAETYSSGSSVA